MQLPLFEPEVGERWEPPSLADLPDWSGAKRIGVDTETFAPSLKELGVGNRRGGFVAGVSFAIEDGPRHYLPIRHQGGDNLPERQVLDYLRAQFKNFRGELVGAHLAYDIDHLWDEGIDTSHLRHRDIQIADPIINELHRSYSLDNIAQRHGLPGKDTAALAQAARDYGLHPKADLWRLPARFVGRYAEQDAGLPLQILRRQERIIEDEDLWDIYDLETDVLPVLVRMRRRGVRVSEERLEGIEQWALQQETEALQRVRDASGVRVAVGDVWKAGALAPALEAIGVELAKTSTGQPSIDKELLGSLDHPVADAIAWARKVNKLRTTFAASIRTYAVNGRIHTTFRQITAETESGDQRGARFGRLSSEHPNMQQQPARDEFAERWRSIYEAEEGTLWASCDYSQQEPRWTTHIAAVMNLSGAREAAQAYHDDPDLDNHQFMADLTGLPRKAAKNVYLGLCYGEGGAKLCRDLGLPTRWALAAGRGRERRVSYFPSQQEALEARAHSGEGYVFEAAGEEGQQVLDTFDRRAPFIRDLAKKAQRKAERNGSIRTVSGRRLNFPQREDGSYDWCHKALNRIIQGNSADQVKRALVEVDRAGHFLQLQVHDELAASVRDREEAEQIAAIMTDVIPTQVPFKVDVEIGPTWGEAK